MDILYISRFTSERLINQIYKESGKNPGFAIQKFSGLFTRGLLRNDAHVDSLSSPPYNRKNTKKRIIRLEQEEESGITFSYIPIYNFPLIKGIVDFFYVFFFVLRWSRLKHVEKAVLFDVLNVSACLSGIIACRLTGVVSVGIVTDMPGLMYGRSKSLRGRTVSAINNSYLGSFKKYIFVTEQMNIDINKKNRPYIIMEGLVDSSMFKVGNDLEHKNNPKEIIYAGGLYERFGIKTLVEAVKSLKRDDIRLILYGDGPMAKELKEEHSRCVEYRGVVPNQEVVQAETQATLLVNPRPTHEAFTRYSFPSKNMEYMISGTPLLTTRLPGMPEEYHPYVYLFDEETIDGYAKKISEVLSLSEEELAVKGQQAKQFVLENKNEVCQGLKVIKLLTEC